MKETIFKKNRKKERSTQGNVWSIRRYKSMRNKANKTVSKAMRRKAEEVLTELQNCTCGMLRLVKGLKTDSIKNVEGRCMRVKEE